MPDKKRFGFTLVELLVVITIIGLLMALLLPAIGRVRDSARRTQCVNQAKQIGTGCINYASKKEYFPGYVSEIPMQNGATQTRVVSWFTQILPMVDQNSVYDNLQQNPGFVPAYVELGACPTDLPDVLDSPSLSYAINMGYWDGGARDVRESLMNGTQEKNGRGWRDEKANGISHNLAGMLGRYSYISGNAKTRAKIKRQAMARRVSPGYVSSNDGSGTTILLSENIDAERWFAFGEENGNVRQRDLGIVWIDYATNRQAQLKINENAGFATDDAPTAARPSSNHNGVVVVTFADGHTVLLNEDIDQLVYGRLLTPDGKRADSVRTKDNDNNLPEPKWQALPVSSQDISAS